MKAYVVRGTRTVNGKSETVWLSWHREAGGAYQWSSDKYGSSAHPFETKEEAVDVAKSKPGPHFNEPADESVMVIDADYTPPQPPRLVIYEDAAEHAF